MLKLMKYEFHRQMFSKGMICGIMSVFVTAFFGFYWSGAEEIVEKMLSLMGIATACIILFAPTEHWFFFHKDIRSRQGYMLFLLPKNSTEILGAKVLVAALQTVVLYGLFFTLVPYCERLAIEKYGFTTGYVSKVLDTILEMMHSANTNIAPIIGVWLSLLVTVLFFSNLGLFIMAVPLPVEKLRGVTRFAGYIVAFALIVFVRTKIKDLLLLITDSATVGDWFEIIYLVVVNLALFYGTAKLLEEKVSI